MGGVLIHCWCRTGLWMRTQDGVRIGEFCRVEFIDCAWRMYNTEISLDGLFAQESARYSMFSD